MRIPRSTGTVSGLLILLLGLWAGLIAFVGPYFDYSFGTNATWHYTTDRLWLDILPGALAVLGGMMLIVAGTRLAGIIGGWLSMIAGAWLVVGPAVSLTWEHTSGPIGRPLYGSTRQMLELVGYFYGAGALIVALSAFAIGRFASRPRLAEDAVLAAETGARRPARRERLARRRAAPEAVAPAATAAVAQPAAGQPGTAAAGEPAVADRSGAAAPAGGGAAEAPRRSRLPFLGRRRQARGAYRAERGARDRTG
jgi:hypothetical protein